jgi:hypothetical protein
MSIATPFSLQVSDLTNLGQDRAVEFLRRLLWAEATRVGIGRNLIEVPQCINVGDGGIDAFIKDAEPSKDEMIPQGTSGFQIKSSDLKPADCSNELHQKQDLNEPIKEEIKRIFDADGTYVLVLFASLTRLQRRKREDAVNQELINLGYKKPRVRLYTADQLVGFGERFPTLVSWFKQELTQCLPYSSWAERQDVIVPKHFVFDENRKKWMDEIRLKLRNRVDRCLVFRVMGLSGIGKTRLVFESLSPDDIRNSTIYVRADQFRLSNLHNMLQNDANLSAIIVIDECDLQQHDEFVRSFSERGPRLAVFTLSYDIGKVPPPSTLFKLDRLAKNSIEEILKREDPALPENVVDRLSQFADGYPRIAVLLCESYRAPGGSTEEFLTISDEALMNRLIGGRSDTGSQDFKTTKRVLMGLSLFSKVGYEGKFAEESKWIAKRMGVEWNAFREVVSQQKERGIMQGQHYVYITPFMLRIHLLKEWWECQGLKKDDFDEFVGSMPEEFRHDLLQRFFDHIPYITTTARGREFSKAILGEDGIFSDGSLLKTDIGADFFLKLTEADPGSALNLLKKTVGRWSKEDLAQFTIGRRQIVWALEMIAMWRDLFTDAARLLLALGEAESETAANNASGVFAELFSPAPGRVAPTEASPEERFPVLEEALTSASEERRLIGLHACDQALRSQHFVRSVGAEFQGLRPEPQLWMPKTYKEIVDYYRRVWQFLRTRLDGLQPEEREVAVNVLLSHVRGIGTIGPLTEIVLETLDELAQKPYVDKKTLLSEIVRVLHYDGKDLAPQTRERWLQLKDRVTGSDFSSLIHRYVGMDLLEDRYDEEGKRVDQTQPRIEDLVGEAIEKPDLLKLELYWLVTTEAQNGFRFGYQLGKKDKGFSLLPVLQESQRNAGENSSVYFLGGYFRAIAEIDRGKWEEQLDRLIEDEKLRRWIPELTWRSGLTDRSAERILALAQKGIIGPGEFRMFAWGSVILDLSEDIFKNWIDFLLDCEETYAASIALALYSDYYVGKESRHRLPEQLTLKLLTHDSLFMKADAPKRDHMDDYIWTLIGKSFVDLYPERSLELADKILQHFGEDGTVLEGFHPHSQEVLNDISRRYPEEVWIKVTQHLGPPIDSRAFKIRQWLRGDKFFETGPAGALAFFPLEKIWEWVDADVDKHAWYLANFVPKQLFRQEGKVCLAREVLVRYGQREDVRRNLIANFSTEGWTGPASLHLQNKKQELLDFRKMEKNENVKLWIDEFVSILDFDIERERIEEERRGF